MNAEKFSIHLVHLKAAYERLLAECALLTDKFNRLQKPDNDSFARILNDALKNKRGWRDEARDALGISKYAQCEECQTPFRVGGSAKRRKTCGNCRLS